MFSVAFQMMDSGHVWEVISLVVFSQPLLTLSDYGLYQTKEKKPNSKPKVYTLLVSPYPKKSILFILITEYETGFILINRWLICTVLLKRIITGAFSFCQLFVLLSCVNHFTTVCQWYFKVGVFPSHLAARSSQNFC